MRGERLAGLGVVLAIFISALVALVHMRTLAHLWLLAAAEQPEVELAAAGGASGRAESHAVGRTRIAREYLQIS